MVHGWKVNVWCVQNHKTKYPKYHVNNAITVINTGFFCKVVTVTIHVIFARQCQKLTDTMWGEKIVCWVFWQMPTAFNTGHAPSPPLPGARSQKEFKFKGCFLPSSSGASNFGTWIRRFLLAAWFYSLIRLWKHVLSEQKRGEDQLLKNCQNCGWSISALLRIPHLVQNSWFQKYLLPLLINLLI